MSEELNITTARMLEITAREAAGELREKDARNAELEAALKMFALIEPYIDSRDLQPVYAFTERMSKAARAALNGEK